MAEATQIERVDVSKLIPYINNAKQHSEQQVTKLAASIREFGFVNPVLIDKDFNVIAGHGRIMAAKKLGLSEVPCLFIEGLSEAYHCGSHGLHRQWPRRSTGSRYRHCRWRRLGYDL